MIQSVIVGIGSNLNEPVKQVEQAIYQLKDHPHLTLLRSSSFYLSAPQGPQDQDDFCNAVVLLETTLPPDALLYALQDIERNFGRIKTRHWGERVIDLDIIFYGREHIESTDPVLRIPHEHALQRDFVVIPILEILPDWRLPDGTALAKSASPPESHLLRKIQIALRL